MKVCFSGASGHGSCAVSAHEKYPELEYAAYVDTYPGEHHHETPYGPMKRYENVAEMLDKEKPDIFVSDGRFDRHTPDALLALRRGIPVFCEKPAAINMAQFEELSNELRKPGAPPLWAMHQSRYFPCFYTAKKLLEEGVIGEIRMMNSQKSYKLGTRPEFYSDRELYGGTLPWVGIHAIDWMLWLSEKKVLRAAGMNNCLYNGGNGDLDIEALAIMEMSDGVIAHVNADFYRPQTAPTHGDDRCRIAGTEGVLEIRDERIYLINKDHDGTEEIPLLNPQRMNNFEDFVYMLKGGKDGLLSTEESLYSTYVSLKCQEAADLKKFIEL